MYAAGLARNKVDWLFGMNLSRLYSIYCSAKCSVGRVQTAVVNMIVQRDREIAAFVKKPYFKLKLENGAEWFDGEVDSFAEQSEAETVKAKCEHQVCTVKSVDTKLKKENRPLLFSLTSLQAEANDKLGFSAATTLTIMQSLYEKKLLTYPRTDSNYITDDMAPKLEGLVKKVRFFDEAAADELILTGLNIDTRVVNNAKVSDHHAILPTEYIDKAEKIELTKEEKAISIPRRYYILTEIVLHIAQIRKRSIYVQQVDYHGQALQRAYHQNHSVREVVRDFPGCGGTCIRSQGRRTRNGFLQHTRVGRQSRVRMQVLS